MCPLVELRTAEPEDIPALRRLGARWEPPDDAALVEEITRGDPAAYRLVVMDAGAVVGFARLLLPARPRLRHLALVDVEVSAAALGPVLRHLREVAFVRMGQARMDVTSADPALTPGFLAAGLAPWIRRRGGWRHDGVTRDLITWGCLAEGLAPPPPLPRGFSRPSSPRLAGLHVRAVRPEDAPQWVANLDDPGVRWGTHQTGTRSVAEWRRRLVPRPSGVTLVVDHAGRIIAQGSIDRLPGDRAHCMVLGISVAATAQGLGAGDRLLAALIDAARATGAARLELQVYADNDRAEALYRKHGFEDEGVSPLGAWREGAWTWDRAMALGL